jgi:hypothetical protein
VFEVGWSDSYADLVADARNWLERTEGSISLHFINKAAENKAMLEKQRLDEDLQRPAPVADEAAEDEADFHLTLLSCPTTPPASPAISNPQNTALLFGQYKYEYGRWIH